jgi:hypothetical protein
VLRKNTASQFITFQGVDATTGGIKSGVTWTVRRCIDGTFAAGGGTVTEDGTTGWYKYALAQADTNGNNIAINFTGTGAVPQTVNFITTACDPTTATNFGITALPTTTVTTNGSLITMGTGTAQLNVSGGRADSGTQAVPLQKLSLLAGSTSQTINVFIGDVTSLTGKGLTGLVFNTASLQAYYALPKAASVSITLATLSAVTSAYSSGGFKEIDATNMPGWYRFDIPNAAIASGRFVTLQFQGATNMAPTMIELELTAVDNQDAVRAGLTALPNATAGANTGLPVVGTQVPNATAGASGGLLISGSNSGTTTLGALTVTGATTLTGNVLLSDGLEIAAPSTANRDGLKITGAGTGAAVNWVAGPTGSGFKVTATGSGKNAILLSSTSGVAISASAGITGFLSGSVGSVANPTGRYTTGAPVSCTSTTIELGAGYFGSDNLTKGFRVNVTSGLGAGQCRIVTGYTDSTGSLTIDRAWDIIPDNTSTIEWWYDDAPKLDSSLRVYALDGSGNAISTLTQAQVTGGAYALNSASFSFNTGLDFTATQKTSLGTAVGTAQTGDSYAIVNSGTFGNAAIKGYVDDIGVAGAGLTAITSLLPTALVGGRMDSSVGAMASGVLTATAIAADAITDAKVASDVTIASVTGSVGSVTGAVGSVTGNVGGNVVGSVGSIATGGIAAASFAAGAIDAAAIATDALGSLELAAGAASEIATAVAAQITTDHGSGSYLTATGFAVAGDAMTLTSAERNSTADAILTRDVSNVEASANDHSLCFVVLASSEWAVSGTTLTVKKTDGSTTFATKTLTKTSGDDPVRGAN